MKTTVALSPADARPPRAGQLVITVDLEPQDLVTRDGVVRGLFETGEQIRGVLAAQQLPATWALAEPARSAATLKLDRASPPHEIALLGEPSWVGSEVTRATFSQELLRRAAHAQSNDLSITSLIARDVLVDDHLDLVVKQGITAVRGLIDVEGRSRQPAEPHALHYGLWEVPGSHRLPLEMGVVGRFSAYRRLIRRMDRAARGGGFFHLVIDVPRIVALGRGAQRATERVLRHIGKLQRQAKVRVETLATVVNRLCSVPARSPQHSILRRAG